MITTGADPQHRRHQRRIDLGPHVDGSRGGDVAAPAAPDRWRLVGGGSSAAARRAAQSPAAASRRDTRCTWRGPVVTPRGEDLDVRAANGCVASIRAPLRKGERETNGCALFSPPCEGGVEGVKCALSLDHLGAAVMVRRQPRPDEVNGPKSCSRGSTPCAIENERRKRKCQSPSPGPEAGPGVARHRGIGDSSNTTFAAGSSVWSRAARLGDTAPRQYDLRRVAVSVRLVLGFTEAGDPGDRFDPRVRHRREPQVEKEAGPSAPGGSGPSR